MNETLAAPLPPAPVDFKDRRTGLMVFGSLEIVFGILAALLIPLMILGQFMTARITQQPPPWRQIVPGVVFYGLVAVVLVVLGIGSYKCRRWARALSLILGWSWLAIGAVSLGAMAFFLPRILNAAPPQGPALPESARLVVVLVSLLFAGIFFIVVPGVLVFFYRSRHVRATCEVQDSLPRWTDACPLPVLGLSLWVGFGAVTMLSLPLSTHGVLPAFGRLLSGVVGSLCCMGLAGLWGYSAWALYRLRSLGWWMVLLSLCVMTASAWVTFTRIDLLEMYRVMGYPEQQIEMMRQYSFIQGRSMVYFSLAGAIPILGFLLFVKRYFRSGPA